MHKLLLILCFVFPMTALAIPIPGGTSKSVEPRVGVFKSKLGFEMSSAGTNWQQLEPPSDNKFISTIYRSPDSTSAALTVRVDRLEKNLDIAAYVHRWEKEFPKYGLKVLGTKAFQQNQTQGYVIDLLNKPSQKQMRQVVFLKDKKAIIMTCRDEHGKFANTLKTCNQIVRSFRWL